MMALAPLLPFIVITVCSELFKHGRCCFILCKLGQNVLPLGVKMYPEKKVATVPAAQDVPAVQRVREAPAEQLC